MTVAIVACGVGNLNSVRNMLAHIGEAATFVSRPEDLHGASHVILPGVGAFDAGMRLLRERDFPEALQERVRAGVPLLGICLGMQLLGEGSAEGGAEGLGLVPGVCRAFSFAEGRELPVPHMGWRHVAAARANPLLTEDESRFYFVHSFHFEARDSADVAATAHYGIEFTAAVARDGVFGVQFHPEKSHRHGMALLRRFCACA